MASPFPGMDPYLEDPAFWPDFHYTFINYWREAIADVLPDEYEANLGEKVYLIECDPDSRKLIGPDVAVSDGETSERETYIEILHRPDRNLVAKLELLSPANKETAGRTEYLAKRNAVLHQAVHWVELDLLVGGTRSPLLKPWPKGDYHCLVSRCETRPDLQIYAWTVRDPLPKMPTPLRSPQEDVSVDLAAVFATAYERGRFGRRMRYDLPCPAPLSDADRSWAVAVATKK